MAKELVSSRVEFKLNDKSLAQKIWKENFEFFGKITEREMSLVGRMIDAARDLLPIVTSLPGNDKRGFILSVSKQDPEFPIFTFECGDTTGPDINYGVDGKLGKYIEFANLKTQILKLNRNFISSAQNHSLPHSQRVKSTTTGSEIGGGAIAVEGYTISVSAFKLAKMDIATAIGIAYRSRLFDRSEAIAFAKDQRVDCLEVIKHQNVLLS